MSLPIKDLIFNSTGAPSALMKAPVCLILNIGLLFLNFKIRKNDGGFDL
jgi:hypothetical protein